MKNSYLLLMLISLSPVFVLAQPTTSNPVSVNVECLGDVPAPDVLVVTDEADVMAVPDVFWEEDVSDGNTCPEIITRSYKVVGDGGNFIFVQQTIIVEDITNPTATNPPTIYLPALSSPPAPDVLVVTDEADICSASPVVTFVSDVSDGLTDPETITRTYCVTDECGNQTCVTQLIIIGGSVGIEEALDTPELLKILDLMGRETTFQTNEVLIYVFSDGSTERRFQFAP